MLATIRTIKNFGKPSLYKININHLKYNILVEKLRKLWIELCYDYLMDNDKVEEILFKGIYKSKRVTCTYSKDKARRKRIIETKLRELLMAMQIQLECDPQLMSN